MPSFSMFPVRPSPSDRQTKPVTSPTTRSSTPPDPLALIQQYQQELAPNPNSIDEIVKRLNAAGVQAARTTHAGNTLVSNDAIVLANGKTLDLLYAGGDPNQHWQLNDSGTYDASRSVVDPSTGKFVPYSQWSTTPASTSGGTGGTSSASTAPGPNSRPSSDPTLGRGTDQSGLKGNQYRTPDGVVHTSISPDMAARFRTTYGSAQSVNQLEKGPQTTSPGDMYSAAYAAQLQARKRAQAGGRASTVLAGFGAGAPTTSVKTALGA